MKWIVNVCFFGLKFQFLFFVLKVFVKSSISCINNYPLIIVTLSISFQSKILKNTFNQTIFDSSSPSGNWISLSSAVSALFIPLRPSPSALFPSKYTHDAIIIQVTPVGAPAVALPVTPLLRSSSFQLEMMQSTKCQQQQATQTRLNQCERRS